MTYECYTIAIARAPAAAGHPEAGCVVAQRIEQGAAACLALAEAPEGPPLLAAAMRHAVFPGGARIRPQLCLAVAQRLRRRRTRALADGRGRGHRAAALRLAGARRPALFRRRRHAPRRASVHAAYGERLAVLAGDALIVLAFQTLADGGRRAAAALLAPLLIDASRAASACRAASSPGRPGSASRASSLADYQRAKTGSLFAAATEAGALAAGADPAPWRAFGDWLGEAYQVADDIRDVVADHAGAGQAGRARPRARPARARPRELGLGGAIEHFDRLVAARDRRRSRPADGAALLRALVRAEAERLVPQDSVRDLALAA